jgi:hypothetical protein
MKQTFRAIWRFFEREWFLIVTAAAIAVIIVLLEMI